MMRIPWPYVAIGLFAALLIAFAYMLRSMQ